MIDEPARRLDEGALRALVPRVLAGLVRRGEGFDAAEGYGQMFNFEKSHRLSCVNPGGEHPLPGFRYVFQHLGFHPLGQLLGFGVFHALAQKGLFLPLP